MGEHDVHETCMALFGELSQAGFHWEEYPTLIDAIERVIGAALDKAHQEHWTFSHPPAGAWDRRLWGVRFSSGMSDRPMLLGQGWDAAVRTGHVDEPTHALLFTSRRAAREWCHKKLTQYAGHTDSCATWRFCPIRVRERVTVLARLGGGT